MSPDEIAAWGALTTAPHEVRILDGGHFYLDTHRAGIADLIALRLDAASLTA